MYTERTPRVIAARRLTRRSHRDAERRFLVEGPQGVREALRLPTGTPGAVESLLATPAALERHPELAAAAEARGVPVWSVTASGLAGLSETVTPQGLVAVCTYLDATLSAVAEQAPQLVAVLVGIGDPGNAGTVLRTADAAGAAAVVFTAGSVDPYNGKCVRASAGSLFHPAVVRGDEPDAVLDTLRGAGLQVLAADANGELELHEVDGLATPTAWLFGNEARGIPGTLAARADVRVRVPLYGRAESLNLAAAAAVCLYASAVAYHRRPRPE